MDSSTLTMQLFHQTQELSNTNFELTEKQSFSSNYKNTIRENNISSIINTNNIFLHIFYTNIKNVLQPY